MDNDKSNLKVVEEVVTDPEKLTKKIKIPEFTVAEEPEAVVPKPNLEIDRKKAHVNEFDFKDNDVSAAKTIIPEETFEENFDANESDSDTNDDPFSSESADPTMKEEQEGADDDDGDF
ncbi:MULTISPECIES: hypothetical protein [Pediococcus]|uniref:hypothetical protein n=1 Tax=Pediococcus TaxID=1253 RepID=UPI000710672B|nr:MULTISPECIES: hypothetical protein [Pediococcus]AVL00181.1 hypothetical protein PI20285_05745 [Pediococcus inopinatus]KRN61807.1 hypothetical protein IV83_GL000512 [Pediococcus inopinatus]PIO80357.1 hypothetical protein BSQ38_01105 [Pediococcus damnosus]